MHIEITVNGKPYELQISAREIINDGRTYVLLSDSETEELMDEIQNGIAVKTLAENRLVELNRSEYELIMEALNCLQEARESEIKWANGDPDIVEPDRDCLDDIEALEEKLQRSL